MSILAEETSHYKEYDYLVVNDDFEKSVETLQCIVRSSRLKLTNQELVHKDLIAQLLSGKVS